MIEFKQAVTEDISSLKELWFEAFKENEEQLNCFFETIFSSQIAYVAKDNESLVAMVYMLDTMVNSRKAAYLYAAATKKEYQGQGIMTNLVDYAINNSNIELCITMPATSSLYHYYEKLGFQPLKQTETVYSREELTQIAKPYEQEEIFVNSYCGIRNRVLKNNFLFWNNNHIDYALNYEESYGSKIIKKNFGYAILSEDKTCRVLEIICDEKNMPYMITDILENTECSTFVFCLSENQNSIIPDKTGFEINYGMVKYLTDYKPDYIYARLLLD